MRRVLKKTGSIYIHCDWHASHYIKSEMDKIFGYENFVNEIIWGYEDVGGKATNYFKRKHDVILFYQKTEQRDPFNIQYRPLSESTLKRFEPYFDNEGKLTYKKLKETNPGVFKKLKGLPRDLNKVWLDKNKGQPQNDWWTDISAIKKGFGESIGYPTQKPIELCQRIIEASTKPGDIVADLFCGGGSLLEAAMGKRAHRHTREIKKRDGTIDQAEEIKFEFDGVPRQFIGCDSSRVAISVSLDRLVKVGEEISGVKSNLSKEDQKQLKLAGEKVSNIEVYYQGVYPVEKFEDYPEEDFIDFVLSSYGASRNTASGITHGYRPPGQQEPVLVGPSDPNKSIDGQDIKLFVNEIKQKLEPNKLVNAKIIGWRFNRQVTEYIKILERYIDKNNLPLKIELISLDSREFRTHILRRLPNVSETDFSLRFSKPPAIGEIKVKKVKDNEYQFEAVDAFSTNEDGWLVNCQWDFDYQEGHFAADKDYILSREKSKEKQLGEIFKAKLIAQHKFENSGEVSIACKVQDNLAGETILSKVIKI